MGKLPKHNVINLTETDIQDILSIHFLTPNAKKYEMENLFVFGWESDYLCITKSDLIYECEIKISRSDFHNDFKHKTYFISKEITIISFLKIQFHI